MKFSITIFTIICSFFTYAQVQDLKGEISASNNLEGIHVLNKTALKYTVTDTDGSFIIPVKLNDTLTISGLAYKTKNVIVTAEILRNNKIKIYLKDEITQLDDVFLGRLLTGNLGSDLKNTKVETPINFYDLGIPGYTGKPKTLSERKLIAATSSGGGIPLVGLINAISGKTKQLKKRLKFEKKIMCVDYLKNRYKTIIFESQNISEIQINRFFNFILDSQDLEKTCKNNNDLLKIEFLNNELKLFKIRQKESVSKN